MNILAINNNSNTNLWNLKKDSEAIQSSRFGLKMSEPLAKDTVSFKAKICFADALVQQASKDMTRLNRIGTTFLDILE